MPQNAPRSTNPHAWLLEDLAKVQTNGVKVLSTFSCGGGSCLGYKRAGCEIVGANDIDPQMATHYKKNLKPKHFFECSVSALAAKLNGSYIMDLPRDLYDIDILAGSPPCSSYTLSGNREGDWGKNKKFREGQAEQVLDDLFFEFLALVERLKPKTVIAENVPGMLMGNAKGYVKLIFQRFEELDYTCQLFKVNAADCGVPQERTRVFFIAIRNSWAEEKKLGRIRLDTEDFKKRHISCQEACSDLKVLTPEERLDPGVKTSQFDTKWWSLTRPGENYAKPRKRAGVKNGLWNWIKHPAYKPAKVLISEHQCMRHWAEPRGITLREFIRLGSFPDDYWAESFDAGKYIIGMSVPPLMAEAVARAVCEQWLGVPRLT